MWAVTLEGHAADGLTLGGVLRLCSQPGWPQSLGERVPGLEIGV